MSQPRPHGSESELARRPPPGRRAARSNARSRRRARSGSGCRRTPVTAAAGSPIDSVPRDRETEREPDEQHADEHPADVHQLSDEVGQARLVDQVDLHVVPASVLFCQMLVRLKPSKNVVPSITATNGDRPGGRVADREPENGARTTRWPSSRRRTGDPGEELRSRPRSRRRSRTSPRRRRAPRRTR